MSTDARVPGDAQGRASADASLATIVAELEEDIVFGRLHPRERLVEDALIARFGATRHQVREALAALERMGLVERRRNVGALVRAFDATEVEELWALRALLETQAARQIPLPVSPDALAALVDIQRRHDDAVADGDARRVFRENLAFHRALFALCPSRTLRTAIDEYARQTHSMRFRSAADAPYRERARDEHWRMIDALHAGERDALVALCAAHLAPARDAYLAVARAAGADSPAASPCGIPPKKRRFR